MNLTVVLSVIALGTALFTVVLGVILSYHWLRFAMNRFMSILAICVFAAVSTMLVITLLSATVYSV